MPGEIGHQNEPVPSQLGCDAPPWEVHVAQTVQKNDWGSASGPTELEPVNADASRCTASMQGVFLHATCRHERCTASFVP